MAGPTSCLAGKTPSLGQTRRSGHCAPCRTTRCVRAFAADNNTQSSAQTGAAAAIKGVFGCCQRRDLTKSVLKKSLRSMASWMARVKSCVLGFVCFPSCAVRGTDETGFQTKTKTRQVSNLAVHGALAVRRIRGEQSLRGFNATASTHVNISHHVISKSQCLCFRGILGIWPGVVGKHWGQHRGTSPSRGGAKLTRSTTSRGKYVL